jgi:hypothetical protein
MNGFSDLLLGLPACFFLGPLLTFETKHAGKPSKRSEKKRTIDSQH